MPNEPGTKSFFGIYSSSTDNENENSATKQDRTPTKQITFRHVKATKSLRPVTNDENSEDDVPLRRLQERKKSFQELIPTPNFAIVKQNPKRKAINYKAQIVTKNLFVERQTHKEKNKKRERNISDTDIKKQRKSNLKEGHQRKVNIKDRSKRCEKGKKVKESKKKSKLSRDEIDTNDRWYCYACNTERLEDMRQCPLCQKWFHEECVGLTKEDTDFACPMCN
ncbi:PHD finger protein ALFIN-LIKE 3-like [Vanessa cardui]|uniref:PHD finger protein ALFIN-LIKE 3-like n=1 Tax=Vanessa cardui TaxID=171605 RepID=UPI001F12F0FF|nr:PHD finger protein ALFIN-LIKE 3-like [Vanessa cardui]